MPNDETKSKSAEKKKLVVPDSDAEKKLIVPDSDAEVLDFILAKDEDELLPWEDVQLPSEGLYYDGKIPDGYISVRPMGIAAEKILATARLAQSGKSLDWLFRKCVRFSNEFDPLDLLAGDRIFLLYYLRGITHGNMYEFAATCPNVDCGVTNTHPYDLNDLIRTKIKPNRDIGEEPFKVILPHLSEVAGREVWVKIRLLRGYDLQDLIGGRTMRKKVQGGARTRLPREKVHTQPNESIDETLSKNLSMVITEAMGVQARQKIDALVNRMHSKDTATIREFLRENSPGIDTSIYVTCPDCGFEASMDLPITEGFFRPAVSRGV